MSDNRTPYALSGAVAPPMPPPRRRALNVEKLYAHLGYSPHPGQRKVHAAGRDHRFRVVDAGRRWGKSRCSPHEWSPHMLVKKPTLGWIVAPTYDLGEKEFRVFWEILVDKLQVPVVKGKTFFNIRTKDFRIETAWGASVEVRSAEHPESLVGEGLDWVIMAECAKLKLSHWEKYIRPTLADKRGHAIFVSTPEGFNWFYDIYQRGRDPDHPHWWSLKSPTWENSRMFPGGRQDPEIVEIEAANAKETFDQEYGAEFTSFAGRIYSEFDEGYHVYEDVFNHDYRFNPAWENYTAFDFGFRNPFVCLNIQVDPEENVYVWDEYYDKGITTPEHARRLKSIIEWKVDGGYYDPAGADQSAAMVQIFHNTSEYNNRFLNDIQLEPAPNDWKLGIARVKEWLKMRDDGQGRHAAKLFVSRNCRQTIREFNTYRVKEQSEQVADKTDPKEEPRKKDDHCMDALRYFFTGHFGLESHYGYSN